MTMYRLDEIPSSLGHLEIDSGSSHQQATADATTSQEFSQVSARV